MLSENLGKGGHLGILKLLCQVDHVVCSVLLFARPSTSKESGEGGDRNRIAALTSSSGELLIRTGEMNIPFQISNDFTHTGLFPFRGGCSNGLSNALLKNGRGIDGSGSQAKKSDRNLDHFLLFWGRFGI